MKPFALLLSAAALLSSCAQWQLGEHLSDSLNTYTGVDLCHPVDGKLYLPAQPPANKAMPFYITAREVSYKLHPHPCLRLYEEIPAWLMYAPASDVEPTGRTVTARIENDGERGMVADEIAELPDCVVFEPVTNSGSEGQHQYAILSEKREEPGLARRALIATCDYLLDPLLTIISTPVYVACILVEAPFIAQQNSAAATEEETPPRFVPEMPYEGSAE